jgi:hypothetical protein
LLCVGCTVHAEGMSLEQIARLGQVGEVAVSPDGRRIAYTRIVPRDLSREDDGAAWSELHVIGANGVPAARSLPARSTWPTSAGRPDSCRDQLCQPSRQMTAARQLYVIPVDRGRGQAADPGR